jgi:hypothetical protein
VLAGVSLLLIAAGTVIWSMRDQQTAGDANSGVPEVSVAQRRLPPPPPETALHSLRYAVENGVRVVKIKLTEGGDELVIDAATGRLLEARPTASNSPAGTRKAAVLTRPLT